MGNFIKIIVLASYFNETGSLSFAVENTNTFKDIYEYIDAMFFKKGWYVDFVQRISTIEINGEKREPISEARIIDLVKANGLSERELYLEICYAGLGDGERLTGDLFFEIRANEPAYHMPHAHVSSSRGSVSIKIAPLAEECVILEGETNWGKYKKKDKNDLLELISNNCEEFITFYNDQVIRHIVPKQISFVFRGKCLSLGYRRTVDLEGEN